MKTLHDPEMELFTRAIDLVAFARRTGYEPRPSDGALGVTVLDHPNQDRIVVAKRPDGPWIYASIVDYEPRRPGEAAERAFSRLHRCIDRAKDQGSIVEFVVSRDGTARCGPVTLERVRECLREFRASGRPLDFEGALRPPPYGEDRERSTRGPGTEARARTPRTPGEAIPSAAEAGLNRGRYDWAPAIPNAPRAADGQEPPRRAPELAPDRSRTERSESRGDRDRRARATRKRSPDRDR